MFHLLELHQNQFLGPQSWPGSQGRLVENTGYQQGLPGSTIPQVIFWHPGHKNREGTLVFEQKP